MTSIKENSDAALRQKRHHGHPNKLYLSALNVITEVLFFIFDNYKPHFAGGTFT